VNKLDDVVDGILKSSAHVMQKREAMLLLKQLEHNEPLDPHKLKPILRGYIAAMDLLITVLG